jgi:hypothetical protein
MRTLKLALLLARAKATPLAGTGRSYPHVFVDGRPFGTAESLHQFGTESIEEIRFINPADATTRYGTGYTGGIIEVILIRSLAG